MARQIQALIIFFCILAIPLVSSLAFEEDMTEMELVIEPRLDGTISANTDCNVSVYSRNNTLFVDAQPMTDRGTEFNYTLNGSDLPGNGEYSFVSTCCASTHCHTQEYIFWVNPGGIEPTEGRTSALSRSFYFIFIIGLLLFVGFYFSKITPVKWTYFLLATLFLLIGVNMIFITLQDEVINPNLEAFFSFFTAASFYVYYFIGFATFGIWTLTAIVTIFKKMEQSKARRLGNI